MPKTKSIACQLQATSTGDGLHIVLPPAVAKALMPRNLPPGTIPIYAVEANGIIQISYEKLEMTIPALIALSPDQFIPVRAERVVENA